MAADFALVLLARLPFELRLVLALGLLLVPFELRALLALELLLLPFELRLRLALVARLVVAVERGLLLALVVRRARPLEALEARVAFARGFWPLVPPARFAVVPVGFAWLVSLEGPRDPLLLLPSFEVKAPTELRRLVMSLPILRAATSAIVAAPAPAANPPAAGTRAFEAASDTWLRVVPTRLMASPTAVAARARVVSLSSTLRAPSGMWLAIRTSSPDIGRVDGGLPADGC